MTDWFQPLSVPIAAPRFQHEAVFGPPLPFQAARNTSPHKFLAKMIAAAKSHEPLLFRVAKSVEGPLIGAIVRELFSHLFRRSPAA